MAADGRRHVLAMGGIGQPGVPANGVPPLVAAALELSGAATPRICVLNTAMGDDAASFLRMYALLSGAAVRVSHLQLFPMPNVSDPEDLLRSQDVIFVGGGSVANMVAVWRTHELDRIMRLAWTDGVVLSGVSAGAICWFAAGTTDSFGRELRAFHDGLGLVDGSFCPHYDSEPGRRPLFEALIGAGTLPAGIACDDGSAAHFAGDELAEIVADRPGALGYRVSRGDDGTAVQETLAVRRLGP